VKRALQQHLGGDIGNILEIHERLSALQVPRDRVEAHLQFARMCRRANVVHGTDTLHRAQRPHLDAGARKTREEPAPLVAIGRRHQDHMMPRSRNAAICAAANPSSARISSVCSPMVGGRRPMLPGVALNSTPGVTSGAGRAKPG
jgi:hypothetical protein